MLFLYFVLALGLTLAFLYYKAYARAQYIIRNSTRPIGYRVVLMSPYSPLGSILPRIPYINAIEYAKMLEHARMDLDAQGVDIMLYSSPFASYFATRDTAVSRKVFFSHRADMLKAAEFYNMLDLYGPNIVSTEGPEWLKHRKVIQPAFSDEALQYTAFVTAHQTGDIIRDWTAAKGKPVSVISAIKALTMKVICDSAFGYDLAQDEASEGPTMLQSLGIIIDNLLLPFILPMWLIRLLPFSTTKNFSSSIDLFRVKVEKLIKERRESKDAFARKDLLNLMIISNDQDSDEKARLTSDELLADSFIFLFAGHETSANTLTWAIGFLSYHPEIQERVYNHIIDVIGKDRDPTFEDYRNLKQVEAVLQEALRLRSPVGEVFKVAQKDLDIEGLFVPKDSIVDMYLSLIQSDERHWKNPTDFDPTRFEREEVAISGGSSDTWFPFSRGPRSCVGFRFALIEMTIALAMLIRKFKFYPQPGVPKEEALRYAIPFLITPATDIHIIPVERS